MKIDTKIGKLDTVLDSLDIKILENDWIELFEEEMYTDENGIPVEDGEECDGEIIKYKYRYIAHKYTINIPELKIKLRPGAILSNFDTESEDDYYIENSCYYLYDIGEKEVDDPSDCIQDSIETWLYFCKEEYNLSENEIDNIDCYINTDE